jgi:hypothetical protein
MQNTRDSSVWRSLAVAFGDGVAFGVGMKLTQSAARQPASADSAEPALAGDRLEELERRLMRLEQAPAALPPGPAGSFDRKVMEAVVNALDARLSELSSQVERRLTETEAKIAMELKTLDQQDRTLASETGSRIEEVRAKCDQRVAAMEGKLALELKTLDQQDRTMASEAASRLEEVRARCDQQLAAFRQSLDAELAAFRVARQELEAAVAHIAHERVAAEMDAYAAKLEPALEEQIAGAVQAAVAPRVAAEVASQLPPLENQLREDIRQSASHASSHAASAAEAAIEERMVPLRAELAARNAEIAGLRQRVAGTDRNTLDVLLAIGRICQEASGRMSGPVAPPPAEMAPVQPTQFEPPSAAMPEPQEKPAPAGEAETPPAFLPIEPPLERNGKTGSQPHSLETLPTPTFGQIRGAGRPWRIPLVSSFLLTTAGLALMRLL